MKLFFCALLLFASRALCCSYDVKGAGGTTVTYDVSALVNFGGAAYRVQDSAREEDQMANVRHTYWFNFCENVIPPHKKCLKTQGTTDAWGRPAAKTNCSANVRKGPNSCRAAAFQTYAEKDGDITHCKRLGKRIDANNQPKATFFSESFPPFRRGGVNAFCTSVCVYFSD